MILNRIVSPSPPHVNWKKLKAVLFHSDDWGCCQFCPDLESANKLLPLFAEIYGEKAQYLAKSTLETPEDLDKLFLILEKYEDHRGKKPVFQAAYIVANPDYEKIAQSNFEQYYDITIPDVPERWQRGDFVAKAKEGIKKGIWLPAYHGNSHFNPEFWLKKLRNNKDAKKAFKEFCYLGENKLYYNANTQTINHHKESIQKGIKRFQKIFGFKPYSTIAPSYIWQLQTEKLFAEAGIKAIQGKNLQQIKLNLWHRIEAKIVNILGYKHALKLWQIKAGDKNLDYNIYYIPRNVYFEPLGQKDESVVLQTYNQIKQAWERNEPAVIITHRINYAFLDPEVVEINLKHLDKLLYLLVNKEKDITFMTDKEVVEICLKA